MVSAQQVQSQGFAVQVRHLVWLLAIAGAAVIAWNLVSLYLATPAYWQTAEVNVWKPKNAVVIDTFVPDGTDQLPVSFEKYKELASALSVHHIVFDEREKTLTYYGKEAHNSTHSYVATTRPTLSTTGPFKKDWYGQMEWSEKSGVIKQSWTRSTRILVGFLLADFIGMLFLLSIPGWGRWNDEGKVWYRREWKKDKSVFSKAVIRWGLGRKPTE
ncbi:MAG: hypothetical protein HYW96_00800 [Candidatus Wildermuthbacteria bacterium]|nr:hypothetical protein [Candidatus Wildermuthbacteria bacterium]